MRLQRMTGVLVAVATTLVASCEESDTVSAAEHETLERRVDMLEARVSQVTDHTNQLAGKLEIPPEPPTIRVPPSQPDRMTYQLVGTAFRDGNTFRYRSASDCEEARQALLDSWRVDDEKKRAQGAVFISRPTPTCLPI
jgi:hypothetical protein